MSPVRSAAANRSARTSASMERALSRQRRRRPALAADRIVCRARDGLGLDRPATEGVDHRRASSPWRMARRPSGRARPPGAGARCRLRVRDRRVFPRARLSGLQVSVAAVGERCSDPGREDCDCAAQTQQRQHQDPHGLGQSEQQRTGDKHERKAEQAHEQERGVAGPLRRPAGSQGRGCVAWTQAGLTGCACSYGAKRPFRPSWRFGSLSGCTLTRIVGGPVAAQAWSMVQLAIRCLPRVPISPNELEGWLELEVKDLRAQAPHATVRLLAGDRLPQALRDMRHSASNQPSSPPPRPPPTQTAKQHDRTATGTGAASNA